jgi:ribosomal protein S18 acetylase RimI-like enzyme
MKFLISAMRIEDFQEAASLWKKSEGVGLSESDSRESVAIFLRRNPGLSFVARDERGELIGAVLCGHDGRRGCLYHLAVAENHRRQGIGTALIEACIAQLRVEGIHRCNIFVYASNAAGKAFWLRHGWKDRDELRMMQRSTGPSSQ